jgi:hypothetical protein
MTQDEVVDMKDFNEWWDSDIPITSPFRKGSPAYWAWAGWQAALREHAMREVQRLGQEMEATQPVAWISTTELLVMRGNAYAGAKDWRVNLGLEPEEGDVGLYTSPPQRTWVGLTDEEIWEWFRDNTALTNESGIRIVRAIEAKLKDKNNVL